MFWTSRMNFPTGLASAIKARADMPEQNYGGNVQISCVMPKITSSVSRESFAQGPAAGPPPGPAGGMSGMAGGVGGSGNSAIAKDNSSAEYMPQDNKLVWLIKKFQGGGEYTLRARITLSQALKPEQASNLKSLLGPISVTFEIPMYNVSKIQVRYLRIAEKHKSYNPYRWVRYVTQRSSYVCRI